MSVFLLHFFQEVFGWNSGYFSIFSLWQGKKVFRVRQNRCICLSPRFPADTEIAGDIYIGAGETDSVRYIARTARKLSRVHPHIRYHISSGDSRDISEQLDNGLIDFGIVFGTVDTAKYNYLSLPHKDTWGVLMQRGCALSEKEAVSPEDLWHLPLILSRQKSSQDSVVQWLQRDVSQMHIAATYSLIYNASLMVDEGFGYAVCLDKLINVTGESRLCFRPLAPTLEAVRSIIWKKYQTFPKATEIFLKSIRQNLDSK